ncbi:hypothetical protein F5B19DRAFT_481800 [Rostrohypoxylon terebratum]|nr:hypothetical protein F5B19DRAFT_481800 [Rostrohypoxylon terebratum]
MESFPKIIVPCANWKDGGESCPSEGNFACNGCKLVVYCGRKCQRSHWGEHKKVCKSYLRDEFWAPIWDLEGRSPGWPRTQEASNRRAPFGGDKYLWGNSPAIDVLSLHHNEGLDYDKDLSILFAACGDLSTVVKTIVNSDGDFHLTVAINDKDPSITARNAILLLLVLTTLDDGPEKINAVELAEDMIHIWYSAMLTEGTLSRLQSKVRPIIKEVCEGISSEDSCLYEYEGREWHFKPNCTFRMVLKGKDWIRALSLLDIPEGLTPVVAQELRHKVVLAFERADYRDRWFYTDASPSMRVAKERFREDGLLLPFSYPRASFNHPNPTIFGISHDWPLDDQADPLGSWPMGEVKDTPSPVSQDLYGRLYFYLRNILYSFIHRLATAKVHFELSSHDVKEKMLFRDMKYDRIEASNLSDSRWLGTQQTLEALIPLLKSPEVNPHATLVTVYLDAITEAIIVDDSDEAKKIGLHMPINPQGAELTRFWDARVLLMNGTKFFHKYMSLHLFSSVAKHLGIVMKDNTVVDPWPTALKIPQGLPGFREEFDAVLASPFTGVERCVEWRKMK